MIGQVFKILSFVYYVKDGESGRTFECRGRGKIKRDGEILVGDYVEYAASTSGIGTIEKILPRKNELVRPYVANVDVTVIVIAPVPKPDYYLVDKIIINCYKDNIEPVLCVNKSDLISDVELKRLTNGYGIINGFSVSAYTGDGLNELKEYMSGKLVCLAGQSAVGKTSLLNALTGGNVETGSISRRIERGKNTTRHTEIYDLDANTEIIDTCGFSLLEIDMKPSELKLYYPEFTRFNDDCKFSSCVHINEPYCAVKRAVDNGEIDKNRYGRYIELYNEIKTLGSKRYE